LLCHWNNGVFTQLKEKRATQVNNGEGEELEEEEEEDDENGVMAE